MIMALNQFFTYLLNINADIGEQDRSSMGWSIQGFESSLKQ